MPGFATDSAAALAPPELTFRDSIAAAAYEEAGIGPDELSLAEVYDLSTALELDWYENIGLCKAGERSEEHTSELQSLMRISYAVFCLKKKNTLEQQTTATENR